MALPTPLLTWQPDMLNQAIASSGTPLTDHRNLLLAIKNSYKNMPLEPWVVEGSSNSVAAGMDAVDRWAAAANLVWANPGTVHSWIVLSQDKLSATQQICIDCTPLDVGVQGPKLTIVASDTGFAGGTTSARPTAADEQVVWSDHWIGTGPATPTFSAALQVFESTNGKATRTLVFINNVPVAFWLFDKVLNPESHWTIPVVRLVLGAASLTDSVLTYDKLWRAAAARARVNAVNVSAYLATEAFGGNAAGLLRTTPGALSSEYDFYGIALQCTTGAARERLSGRVDAQRGMYDLWFGCSARGLPADTYPGSGDRIFVQFGSVIMVWDGAVGVPGSVPLTA